MGEERSPPPSRSSTDDVSKSRLLASSIAIVTGFNPHASSVKSVTLADATVVCSDGCDALACSVDETLTSSRSDECRSRSGALVERVSRVGRDPGLGTMTVDVVVGITFAFGFGLLSTSSVASVVVIFCTEVDRNKGVSTPTNK